MNFKDEYNKLQENISPGAEFLERLAGEMELQKQKEERKKTARKRLQIILFPTAAAMCAGAAAAFVIMNRPQPVPPKPAPPVNVVVGEPKIPYMVGIFENAESFSDTVPLAEQLSEMLYDSEAALYKSGQNKFEPSDKQTDQGREALAEGIKNASETAFEPNGSAEHYMLIRGSGDVIKFRIYGDILEINDKFFKIP